MLGNSNNLRFTIHEISIFIYAHSWSACTMYVTHWSLRMCPRCLWHVFYTSTHAGWHSEKILVPFTGPPFPGLPFTSSPSLVPLLFWILVHVERLLRHVFGIPTHARRRLRHVLKISTHVGRYIRHIFSNQGARWTTSLARLSSDSLRSSHIPHLHPDALPAQHIVSLSDPPPST